jgi:DNA-binding SARP family transcriptional activator/TolB-like protein
MQAPKSVTLRTLGQFALHVEGAAVRISSRKGCGLLAVLAMHPDYKESRKALATLLWGDRYDKYARQNLRQCLTALRTDLASHARDLLVFDGDMIGLNPELISIDAREFLMLAESTDRSDVARGATLYRGEFLAGLSVEIETFDEWLATERARLLSAATGVFAAHAVNCDRLGDGRRAIEAAERLVALDPLREDSQRLLLTLYARHNGRDAALAHFKTLTSLLKRELGVEPDASTASLVADIRSGVIAPSAPIGAIAAPSGVLSDQPEDNEKPDLAHGTDQQSPARNGVVRPNWRPWAVAAACGSMALAIAWLSVGIESSPPANGHGPTSIKADDIAALNAKAVITVAVLPFSTPAGNGDQALADAIAGDLSTYLSRHTGVRVIPHQSMLQYRNRLNDAASVGAAFGVRYVVDGTLRTQGERGRITIQLIDTTTRLQKWSNVIERDDIQSIDVQDEIVKRLARELQVEASISPSSPKRGIENAEIADLIARGRSAQFRGANKEDVTAALGYYEEALRRDPDLVPALVGVTAALVMGSMHRLLDPAPSLERARELIDRAVRLNPDAPGAHYWSGITYKANARYELAARSLRRSIEINPGFSPAYAQLASTLMYLGHFLEAKEHIETAIRLSPKDRTMGFWLLIQGNIELELGDDVAALELLQRAETYLPASPKVHECLAAVYAIMGDKANSSKHVAAFQRYAVPTAAKETLNLLRRGNEGELSHRVRMRIGLRAAFLSRL